MYRGRARLLLLLGALAASECFSPVGMTVRKAAVPQRLSCPVEASGERAFLRDATVRIGCSAAASATTWALAAHCGLGSVASSSVVGLAAGLTLPTPLATAAFCGTFAGMSSRVIAPRITDAAVLGGAATAILAALDASNTRLLKGVGGRLGAVAALAVLASVAATAELRAAGLLWRPSLAAAAAAPKALLPTVGATVLGSAATRLWARRLAALLLVGTTSSLVAPSADSRREALALSFSNPVTSASVVGLFSSLALAPTRSRSLAAPVFAGTFVAMSAPDTLASTRAILGAAALAGLAQAGLAAVCVGGGGKLGAAAAIGVTLLRAARAAAALVLLWRARPSPSPSPSPSPTRVEPSPEPGCSV